MEEEKPVEICEMIRIVATTKLSCQTQFRLSGKDEYESPRSCALLLETIRFLQRQIIDYPNPDVMKMFEMLGLNPHKPFTKFLNQQLKLQILNLLLLEKTKMVETRSHY
jgi:biotin synthase